LDSNLGSKLRLAKQVLSGWAVGGCSSDKRVGSYRLIAMSGPSHVDVPFTEPSAAHLTCSNGSLSAAGETDHSVSENDKVPDKAHDVAKQTSNRTPALTPHLPVARAELVASGSNLDSFDASRSQLPGMGTVPGASTARSQASLGAQGNNLTRGLSSHNPSSQQEHDVASASGTQRSPQLACSHKRTATGEIKPLETSVAPPPSPGTISTERHPAESIGWRSRGSKIAAVNWPCNAKFCLDLMWLIS
jgi:hypothetical protein